MQTETGSDGRRTALFALFIVLVGLFLHLQPALRPEGFVATGRLLDTDAYVRTMRVERLYVTGLWHDTNLPQLNAPEGLSVHWTRPLDLLILLPASAVAYLAGLGAVPAIFWTGAFISPLLHIASALLAAWAARALWPATESWFATLALLANPVLSRGYGAAGYTDHHTLLLLALVLGIGAALRAIQDLEDRRSAALAGLALGAGIWVSPEALIVAGPVLAAFGAIWWHGACERSAARQGLCLSAAMLATLLVAVAVEQPPARWLAGEYDNVSAQHGLIALLACAGFAILGACGPALSRRRKLGLGALVAGVALACLLSIYPQALASSKAAAAAGAAERFLPYVVEMQPLALTAAGLHDVLLWAGGGVASLLALPVLLREGRWPAALLLGIAAVAAILATFAHRRFAVDLAAVTAPAAAGLVWFAVNRLSLASARLRAIAVAGAIGLACGVPFLSMALPSAASPKSAAESCDWAGLGSWLAASGPDRPAAARDAAPIVLTDAPDATPDLAYHTGYRFVAAPYHRAGTAFQDTYDLLTARDDGAARAILARRGIGLVLLCTASRPINLDLLDRESLDARLRAGDHPHWLRPVALPPTLGGAFRLYRVQDGEGPGPP
jgi:hypothetical protein